MLYPPGFYYVKKPKRFVILSSDKSSERNLSWFFDIIKPRRIEHLQKEEHFSSDPYVRRCVICKWFRNWLLYPVSKITIKIFNFYDLICNFFTFVAAIRSISKLSSQWNGSLTPLQFILYQMYSQNCQLTPNMMADQHQIVLSQSNGSK